MMKAILFLSLLLSFLTTQVLAKTCELHCELTAVNKIKETMPKGHECCDSSEKNESTSPFKCMGEFGSSCLHELDKTESKVVWKVENMSGFETLIGHAKEIRLKFFKRDLNRVKLPPNRNRNYLRFKSLLRIHILKDQFLI